MSEENKAIVARWFTEFWGNPWNPAVVNELAAPVNNALGTPTLVNTSDVLARL